MLAVRNGHARCARVLLKQGANPNERDPAEGTYPLVVALDRGFTACALMLLEGGADANVTDSTGESALVKARRRKSQITVNALIRCGAREHVY